jgi:hypothetical protein
LPPTRSLSNISGVSSTISEVFQQVGDKDDFSVDTPQSYRAGDNPQSYHTGDSVDGSSVSTATETSTSAGSEGFEKYGDAECRRQFRTCLGTNSSFNMNDVEVFAKLLLSDVGIICGGPTPKRDKSGRAAAEREI